MANYKEPPTFRDKHYERYIHELNALTFITELEKDKQTIAVALSFQRMMNLILEIKFLVKLIWMT